MIKKYEFYNSTMDKDRFDVVGNSITILQCVAKTLFNSIFKQYYVQNNHLSRYYGFMADDGATFTKCHVGYIAELGYNYFICLDDRCHAYA